MRHGSGVYFAPRTSTVLYELRALVRKKTDFKNKLKTRGKDLGWTPLMGKMEETATILVTSPQSDLRPWRLLRAGKRETCLSTALPAPTKTRARKL